MTTIQEIALVIEKLEELIQTLTHNSEEINMIIQNAISKLKKKYNKMANELKRTARSRLINCTVIECINLGLDNSIVDENIASIIDAICNYRSYHDLEEGKEFFLEYWIFLDRSFTYSNGRQINKKRTRFYNDIRRRL